MHRAVMLHVLYSACDSCNNHCEQNAWLRVLIDLSELAHKLTHLPVAFEQLAGAICMPQKYSRVAPALAVKGYSTCHCTTVKADYLQRRALVDQSYHRSLQLSQAVHFWLQAVSGSLATPALSMCSQQTELPFVQP